MGLAQRDLFRLLPPGPAWPRDPDGPLGKLLSALGAEFDRAEGRLDDVLAARDPRGLEELARTAWEATGFIGGLGWKPDTFIDLTDLQISDAELGALAVVNLRSSGQLTIPGVQSLVDVCPEVWAVTLLEAATTGALAATIAIDSANAFAVQYLALLFSAIIPATVTLTFEYAPAFFEGPAISGTAGVGNLLTESHGAAAAPALSATDYQWTRDGVDIGGATSSTYTQVVADSGFEVACRVTLTNSRGVRVATSPGITVP